MFLPHIAKRQAAAAAAESSAVVSVVSSAAAEPAAAITASIPPQSLPRPLSMAAEPISEPAADPLPLLSLKRNQKRKRNCLQRIDSCRLSQTPGRLCASVTFSD